MTLNNIVIVWSYFVVEALQTRSKGIEILMVFLKDKISSGMLISHTYNFVQTIQMPIQA